MVRDFRFYLYMACLRHARGKSDQIMLCAVAVWEVSVSSNIVSKQAGKRTTVQSGNWMK